MTEQEREAALKTAESLVYEGAVSAEAIARATGLQLWEITAIEHDSVYAKHDRLRSLRGEIAEIDLNNHSFKSMQEQFIGVMFWGQSLIYNRELTGPETRDLQLYLTLSDVEVHAELAKFYSWMMEPDAELMQHIHSYIDRVYARFLRWRYDIEEEEKLGLARMEAQAELEGDSSPEE